MLSKPNWGLTEFQLEGSDKYTLTDLTDVPFEWLDAAIEGLRNGREFCLRGYTHPDDDKVFCIVSRWNCHVTFEANLMSELRKGQVRNTAFAFSPQ